MRSRPISVDIEEAGDLKTLSILAEEMRVLLFKTLRVDRRTLKNKQGREYFKAKLQLYCTLYKKCRQKFLTVQREVGPSTYYKVPILFEELIKDFNWEKTVTYSTPVKKNDKYVELYDEKENQSSQEYQELVQHYLIELQQLFMKLFYRNDPEVQQSAIKDSLIAFIEKHKDLTSPDVLQKAYHEIRSQSSSKTTTQKVEQRVGNDVSDEPLTSLEPSNGEIVQDSPQRVLFLHAGNKVRGYIKEQSEVDFYIIGEDGTKYPKVKPNNVLELLGETELTSPPIDRVSKDSIDSTTTSVSQPAAMYQTEPRLVDPIDQPLVGNFKEFKKLSKEEKYSIVEKYWDQGVTGCSALRKKLVEDGYDTTLTYDDVYYPFEKVKQAKKK